MSSLILIVLNMFLHAYVLCGYTTRNRESGRGVTCWKGFCINCLITGMEELVTNNNIIEKRGGIYIQKCTRGFPSSIGRGCRIHRLHIFREVRPPARVLDMTLNHLMARKFRECGIPLHCHCSQVHYGPEW